jgi:uncharacterized membrane protein (DUF2068 family)
VLLAFVSAFAWAIGVLALIISFGLWKGVKWAWWLTVMFFGLNIVLSLLITTLGGLIVSIIILYYMTRKKIKNHFGVRFSLKVI